jgi:hypothetical protein
MIWFGYCFFCDKIGVRLLSKVHGNNNYNFKVLIAIKEKIHEPGQLNAKEMVLLCGHAT